MGDRPNIVLVHGAWADRSSWSAAIERLQASGCRVTAPQFAITKLADDALGLGTYWAARIATADAS